MHFRFLTFSYLFILVYLHVHICHSACVEVKEQLLGASSLLPLEYWGWNSGHQAQQWAPLSAESSHQSSIHTLKQYVIKFWEKNIKELLKVLENKVKIPLTKMLIFGGNVLESIFLKTPIKMLENLMNGPVYKLTGSW